MKRFLLIVLVLLFCGSVFSFPQLLPVQGKLKGNTAGDVNKQLPMTFSFYSVASGGSALWSETRNVDVNIIDADLNIGVFNILLGDSAWLDINAHGDWNYLGITIQSNSEMSPRIRLGASAYSFIAQTALSVDLPWLFGLVQKTADQNNFFVQLQNAFLYDTNTQTACDDNQILMGNGTCVNYTPSVTFLPSSATRVYGTDFNNINVNALKVYDSNSYTVREAAGANPLQVDVNFVGVDTFDSLVIRERYVGGAAHQIIVEIYDYVLNDWESYLTITDQSALAITYLPVFDPNDHNSGGLVKVRFRHDGTGVANHYLYLDFVWLQKGTTTLTNSEHDSLGGRNSINNHPWALPKVDANAGWYGKLDVNAHFVPFVSTTNINLRNDLNISQSANKGVSIQSDANRICFPSNSCELYIDFNGTALVFGS